MANVEAASVPGLPEEQRRRLMSFVICGGGPTGIEFCAELHDLLVRRSEVAAALADDGVAVPAATLGSAAAALPATRAVASSCCNFAAALHLLYLLHVLHLQEQDIAKLYPELMADVSLTVVEGKSILGAFDASLR